MRILRPLAVWSKVSDIFSSVLILFVSVPLVSYTRMYFMPIPAARTLGSFVNQAHEDITSLDPYWHSGLTSVDWSKLLIGRKY